MWSFGILAVELATGEPPNMRKPQREIIKSIMRDPAPELGDRWSPLFQRFVNKCLMKNIRSRPSARELLEDEFLAGAADYAEDFGNLVI